jgi:hypothetical protein
VGIVRRVVSDEPGNRYVGIQMLATGGAAVTVLAEGARGCAEDPFSDGELCILLPSSSMQSGEATLLLRPGVFSARRAFKMRAYDKEYALTPMAVVQTGDDFQVARFQIVERE